LPFYDRSLAPALSDATPSPNTVTDKYDEQYDRDRKRDNNGDGLGVRLGEKRIAFLAEPIE
jgi:hypothetical protein